MREQVTVQQAIRKGRLTISITSIIILFIMFFGSIFLSHEKYFEDYIILIGIFLGIILAWLYWSISSTKWRIWAFENVRNVHELKRKAIQNNLIFKDDSWFKKTEIINYEQKQKLKQLEKKFLEEDVYRDDINVAKETHIHFSIGIMIFSLLIGLSAFGFGLYRFIVSKNNIFLLMLSLGVFFLYRFIIQVTTKEPHISLSAEGIKLIKKDFMKWEDIKNEYVEIRGSGKHVKHLLSFDYRDIHQEISINELNTNYNKLEYLLQVYRVRYEKNNPN